MINLTLNHPEGIAIVEPDDALSAADFEQLTATVDAYLTQHESLNGLLIHTREFPGWESFAGFISHMKFVRDHHEAISHVALVTDSKLANIAPRLAQHFVSAEVKAFPFAERDAALSWIRGD